MSALPTADALAVRMRSEREAEQRRAWLRSREGAAMLAAVVGQTQQFTWDHAMEGHREWKGIFEDRYGDLWDRIEAHREAHRAVGGDGFNVNQLRNEGVKSRWEFERLFAREGGSDARDILDYRHYENGASLARPYTDEQWDELLRGERVTHGGAPLQGHHIKSVAADLTDGQPDAIDDPNNVRLMTSEAHLRDPDYGHGGDYHQSTSGDGEEVHDRFLRIVHRHRETKVFETVESHEVPTALAAGILAGSIAAIVRLHQLRRDPRPWNQKTALLATTFALRGLEAAAISFVAVVARDEVSEFVVDAAQDLATGLGGDLSGDVLTGLAGSASGIAAALAIRTALRAASEFSRGVSAHQVGTMVGEQLLIIGAEQMAFLALGILLDAVTPIPDPVIGPMVTGARILYGLGKFAHSYSANTQSRVECTNRRLNALFEMAAAAAVTA